MFTRSQNFHCGSRGKAFTIEQLLARDLRIALHNLAIGNQVPETEFFGEAQSALEYFVPAVLSEVHHDWKYESLDGVCPESAIKTGDREIEIIGTAIVISDQTMVPIHVVIRVAETEDSIEYMECKLGELSGRSMKRVPYGHKQSYRLSVASRMETIQWAYHVVFGTPRQSREL